MNDFAQQRCFLSIASGSGGTDESRKPLQGSWMVVLGRRDGKPADDLLGHRVIFADSRFSIRTGEGQVLFEGEFSINPGSSLAGIDFRHSGGHAKGQTWLGVLSVDADTMTICDNASDPGQPRPGRFWPIEAGYVTVVLKRNAH